MVRAPLSVLPGVGSLGGGPLQKWSGGYLGGSSAGSKRVGRARVAPAGPLLAHRRALLGRAGA